MNEVMINTGEVESVWEKDHLCFVKMKSGKVWLCPEYANNILNEKIRLADYIKARHNDFVTIPLSQRGDKYGR